MASFGLSERQLLLSSLGKQRHKHHRSVDTSDACIPLLVAHATATAVAGLAYHDLKPVACRQSIKLHHPGFSRESLATVPAIGHDAALGWWGNRTVAAVAATAIVASLAVCPSDRFAILQAATSATVTTAAAGCPMDLLSNPQGCSGTATAATAAGSAIDVQALNTERPAATTTAPSSAHNKSDTVWRSPWPREDSRFGDAS